MIGLKKKKEEVKEEEPSRFPMPSQSNFRPPQVAPAGGIGGIGGSRPGVGGGLAPEFGNPFFTEGGRQRHIIGDEDPLRIGGQRGPGVSGNLVGPNAGIFNPNGSLGGGQGGGGGGLDPSMGGLPDDDIFPQFPRRQGMGGGPLGGGGGFGGGLGGGFGGGFGGGGQGFGGGDMYG